MLVSGKRTLLCIFSNERSIRKSMKKPKSNRKQKTPKKKKKVSRVRKSKPGHTGITGRANPDETVLSRILERIDRLAELDDEDIAALEKLDQRDFTGMEKPDHVDVARVEEFFASVDFDALPLDPDSPEFQALEEAQTLLFTFRPPSTFLYDMRPDRLPIGRAHRALEISPHCAEAYAILGWHCTNPEDEVALYVMAERVASSVLGAEFIAECFGELSSYDESGPLLFALASLLQFHIKTHDDDQAVDYAQVMLSADGADVSGIRYYLLPKLIEMDADDDAEEVYAVVPADFSTTWAYSRALLDFRKSGDSDVANASLDNAFRHDVGAALYLTDEEAVPGDDRYNIFSDKDEGAQYPLVNRKVWQKTEGALRWMKDRVDSFSREWHLKEEEEDL